MSHHILMFRLRTINKFNPVGIHPSLQHSKKIFLGTDK